MKLKRHILIVLLSLVFTMPMIAQAKPVAVPFISVWQVDGMLKVKANKENTKVFVYSILGNLVAERKMVNAQDEIQLNLSKGYYIIKVNDEVRKVVVR